MEKAKEESEALVKPEPETENALALSDEEMDDMYGESAPDHGTPLSFNHAKILRESAQFELTGDEQVKTLTGHVLYKHRSNRYFEGKYDASSPAPPVCYSIDGIAPCGGENVQSNGLCNQCPQDKYGTGTDSQGEATKGKACKNLIRFLFLPEGSILPITITAPPTSLSGKGPLQQWLNKVPDDVAKAYKPTGITNKKKQPIVDFIWARVEMSLEKKVTSGGEASILRVETLDVLIPDTDENKTKCRLLHEARKTYKEVYIAELETFIQSEADDPPPADDDNTSYTENDEIPV